MDREKLLLAARVHKWLHYCRGEVSSLFVSMHERRSRRHSAVPRSRFCRISTVYLRRPVDTRVCQTDRMCTAGAVHVCRNELVEGPADFLVEVCVAVVDVVHVGVLSRAHTHIPR